ncbi:terminal uridylyltransferase 4-like [Brevipalpus obovatus]|uniref:terminal uridylyltransferase 4-like n=1 Tax=Brevipalpus obovatus TaxID=246614 RepID=UPI003D9F9449
MSMKHDINFYRLNLQRNISDITDRPSLSPVFSDSHREDFDNMINRSSQSASSFRTTSTPGFLRKNCIRTRADPKNPAYFKAYCDLCDEDFSIDRVEDHCRTRSHETNLWHFNLDGIVSALGSPCKPQIDAITRLLSEQASQLLTQSDIEYRTQVVSRLQSRLSGWAGRNCILRIYGSTVNGFGTKSSDVNVELSIEDSEEDDDSFLALDCIYNNLKRMPSLNVEKDFDIPIPRLSFLYIPENRDEHECLCIVISVSASLALKMSKLLDMYARLDHRGPILGSCFRFWAKNAKLDRSDDGLWPPFIFPILTIHFLQNCSPPVLPSLQPSDTNAVNFSKIEQNFESFKTSWVSSNAKSVGELWIEMLKYFTEDFQIDSHVITLRKPSKPITINSKKWNTTILAIEDPLKFEHNLARCIGERRLFVHYHEMLVKTYHYFTTPRCIQQSYLNPSSFSIQLVTPQARSVEQSDGVSSSNEDSRTSSLTLSESDNDEDEDGARSESVESNSPSNKKNKKKISELKNHAFRKFRREYGIVFVMSPSARSWTNRPSSDFHYSLDISRFDFYRPPPRFCKLCRKIGHSKRECPASKLPPLQHIPSSLPPIILEALNQVCEAIFHATILNPVIEQDHSFVLQELTNLIKPKFPKANLELFGSSKNGFGARNCDLDICMTFEDDPTGSSVDQSESVKQLAEILGRSHIINHVLPIAQAKVPIVKFRISSQRTARNYDCDISLYNLLGTRNTKLLRQYTMIDERVSKLGIVVKKLFKVCGICDASKGSLSSYAYTLMTLYYLQRCRPPVIPVLQELYEGEKPEILVEGFNTWFLDDDGAQLHELWPHRHTNNMSLGELFIGFLRFFSEQFQFSDLVVCTRQTEELTKLEKKWTGKPIAIEDPFLLTHNLGQGLTFEMAKCIRSCFIKARNHIGSTIQIPANTTLEYYFFDKVSKLNGQVPYTGCHNCHSIGHIAAKCTEKPRPRNHNGPFNRPNTNPNRRNQNGVFPPLGIHRGHNRPMNRRHA